MFSASYIPYFLAHFLFTVFPCAHAHAPKPRILSFGTWKNDKKNTKRIKNKYNKQSRVIKVKIIYIFDPLGFPFVFFLSTITQHSEFWCMGVASMEYGNIYTQVHYLKVNLFFKVKKTGRLFNSIIHLLF